MRPHWVLAISAVVGLGVAAPAQATFPGRDGRFAFDVTEGRPAHAAAYTMNADGTGRKRVASGMEVQGWSRDGARVLLIRRTATQNSLWSVKGNGTGRRQIPLPARIARNLIRHAAWAPDGRHVAFSLSESGRAVIYTMRTDGKKLERIAVNADWPEYSAAGLIAFRRMRPNDSYISIGLGTMRADGSHVRAVTNGQDDRPSFSPDGRRLLFRRLVTTGTTGEVRPAFVSLSTRKVTFISLPEAYNPDDLDRSSPLVLFGVGWTPAGEMFYTYSYTDVSSVSHVVVMALSAAGTDARERLRFTMPDVDGAMMSLGFFSLGPAGKPGAARARASGDTTAHSSVAREALYYGHTSQGQPVSIDVVGGRVAGPSRRIAFRPRTFLMLRHSIEVPLPGGLRVSAKPARVHRVVVEPNIRGEVWFSIRSRDGGATVTGTYRQVATFAGSSDRRDTGTIRFTAQRWAASGTGAPWATTPAAGGELALAVELRPSPAAAPHYVLHASAVGRRLTCKRADGTTFETTLAGDVRADLVPAGTYPPPVRGEYQFRQGLRTAPDAPGRATVRTADGIEVAVELAVTRLRWRDGALHATGAMTWTPAAGACTPGRSEFTARPR